MPAAEQSSSFLIVAAAVLILLMLFAAVRWTRRINPLPKPPLHTARALAVKHS